MNTQNKNWKQLSNPFNEEIKDALQQQHQAAQFIAFVGKHLIPNKADDSNTNMEFIFDDNILLGNPLPSGFRVALRLTDLKLSIFDKKMNSKKDIFLDGKTKKTVFGELKQGLLDLGVDVTNFTDELHYEIPEHHIDSGAAFSLKNKSAFIENANYRQNAKLVLNDIAPLFNVDETIRIWPHHFDTGAYFVISKNENGDASQSIGIGLAIPDSMVDEPYYYLSFWSEKSIDGSNDLVNLIAGQWMIPNWSGAVLRHSEIMQQKTPDEQYELVKSFYSQGIEMIMKHLKQV
ncbi:MAG: hypothetical protein PF484_13515 [Bacteroidales bacterium]|jgi:hypothetical protein|nr:hypothetical protein [Bacteroidales bacterium]